MEVLGIKKAERRGVFFFIYHEGSLGLCKSGLRETKKVEGESLHFSTVPTVGRFALRVHWDYPNPDQEGNKKMRTRGVHFSTVPTVGRFSVRVHKDYPNPDQEGNKKMRTRGVHFSIVPTAGRFPAENVIRII